MNKYKLI